MQRKRTWPRRITTCWCRPELPRHIRAIALTAYVREEDRDRAIVAGFDAHMGKPVEPPGLIDLIERLVLPAGAVRTDPSA